MALTDKRFGSANVRCVTLIGHVDHGKSSYADSLLAANGIISSRMAGQVRYLDAREDEQERGITMEASAVSLTFKLRKHGALNFRSQGSGNKSQDPVEVEDYMINLIDTPGHVDFSSEVSSASRLCDGALVIVDVIEGVCTQTVTVLRQAWNDRLRPILVLNKMDRLVTDLRLTPIEAYHHLTQVLENVNAVMGSFFASERMEVDERWHEEREKRLAARRDTAAGEELEEDNEPTYEELNDEDLYFDPARGNVIFASAIDNWAFRLERFSVLYAKKLGIEEARFRKVLWGDYFFDPKAKRVLTLKQKEKERRNLKPMFVQFVLENLWAVYESMVVERDQDKIEKIVQTLGVKVLPRDLRAKDTSSLRTTVFSQWLPLASCTFSAVVSNIPSPQNAQAYRVPKILQPDLPYFNTPDQLEPKTNVEKDMFASHAGDDAYSVAYVSKIFAVPAQDMPEAKKRPLSADEMRAKAQQARERARAIAASTGASVAEGNDGKPVGVDLERAAPAPAQERRDEEPPTGEVLMGFSRLYSGTLRSGQLILAILPKFRPELGPRHPANARHVKIATVEALYMLMGRELVAVSEVPAGNVFGIRGLSGSVLRNATLFAPPVSAGWKSLHVYLDAPLDVTQQIVNLSTVTSSAAPIVRVALEPTNPSEIPKLVEGLKLLNQSDPCVQVLVQDTGEHVIIGAGELHVERCVRDLEERFANIKIQVSPPIVPFRETAIKAPDMAPPKTEGAPRGTIRGSVSNGLAQFQLRSAPLPAAVTDFLIKHAASIQLILRRALRSGAGDDEIDEEGEAKAAGTLASTGTQRLLDPEAFWTAFDAVISTLREPEWRGLADQVWALGPKQVGPNLLIDRSGVLPHGLKSRTLKDSTGLLEALDAVRVSDGEDSIPARALADAVETGWQMAMQAGPMAAEPVQGMVYFVEKIEVSQAEEGAHVPLAQVAGQLLSAVREASRQSLLDWSPRMMLAMYSCDVQASAEVLGKVHAVLSRRRGRITSEEMKEGTSFFTVGALLPVAESFGFADEIRKRTSGNASPQLVFAGFELFDLDPFWVPRTEEELEDLGERGDRENLAERYMNQVRRRKGLSVKKRIVEAADKQRTLKSN